MVPKLTLLLRDKLEHYLLGSVDIGSRFKIFAIKGKDWEGEISTPDFRELNTSHCQCFACKTETFRLKIVFTVNTNDSERI